MIPETPIIRMLLNSHNLNTVISGFRYTRQYFLTELIISPYPFFFLEPYRYDIHKSSKDQSLHGTPSFSKPVRILRFPTCALNIFVCSSCTTRLAHAGIRSPSPPFQRTFSLYKSPCFIAPLCNSTSHTPGEFFTWYIL